MLKIEFNQQLFDKHVKDISIKLKKAIEAIDTSGLNSESNDCLKDLSNEKEIANLLSANSFQLKLYIEYFRVNYPTALGVQGQKKDAWVQLYRMLREDIFEKEYKNWGGRRQEYGAYYFVDKLGLKTCPYCNRNYTFVVDEDNGKLRPEIDHFYPKSLYPFLAMSFYNLIPSCQICNHTKSSTLKEELENPYDITPNSYKFTYIPKNIDFTLVEDDKYKFDNFEIKITGKKDNLELFKLNELYEQHKDIVLELLVKKVYYPKSYIEELERFGFKSDEIYRYLLCNYQKDEDLHKRPLSKLIKDISEELGLV